VVGTIIEAEAEKKNIHEMRVIFNVLKFNPQPTVADLTEIVKKANSKLNEININLVISPPPTFLTKVHPADLGVGENIDKVEMKGPMGYNVAGVKELIVLQGAPKFIAKPGIKAWVPQHLTNIGSGSADPVPGASNGAGVPVIYIPAFRLPGDRLENIKTDLIASSLIHEVGHKVGLFHGVDTTARDDDKTSNPMTPSDGGRDTFVKNAQGGVKDLKWSESQKEAIKTSTFEKIDPKTGKSKTIKRDFISNEATITKMKVSSVFPATPTQTQHAGVFDDFGDALSLLPDVTDILLSEISSQVGDDNISALITTDGLFPANQIVEMSFSIFFDIDDNPETGIPVALFPEGFDREARIAVTREMPEDPLTVEGILFDWNADTFVSLDVAVQEIGDELDIARPVKLDRTNFLFNIPKSSLGFSVTDVPIGIMTLDLTTSFFDTASATFDREFYLSQPSMTLDKGSVVKGDTVMFDIVRLTPNTNFDLFLDNRLTSPRVILSGTTDSNGDFSGSFVFPANPLQILPPPPGVYFVTAIDAADMIAFSVLDVICSVPISGDWTVTSSCTLGVSATAPANVIVPSGVDLTVESGITFIITSGNNLLIKSGGVVQIESGGTIIVAG